jgi:CheY-like chemotaxis protein
MMDPVNPDIILPDLHLQQPIDGLEIARIIDDNDRPPHIFITANADMLIIQEALQTKHPAILPNR